MSAETNNVAEETSAATARSAAPQLSRPRSLLGYSPAFVLFAIVIADAGRNVDPDTWGHLLYGGNVLARHQLAFSNYVSYSAPTHPILTHEWMSETMMAWIFSHFGVLGLKFWKFAMSATTIVLLALIAAETHAAFTIQLAVLLCAALGLGPEMQMRPQLFDFVIVSAILLILTRHNYARRVRLWLIVPLMTLWANLHGGFFVGLVILGVYASVQTAEDVAAGRGLRRAIQLWGLLIASVLATLVNPFGIEDWFTIISQVRNPVTRRIIGDWLPIIPMIVARWRLVGLGMLTYGLVLAMMAATVGLIVYRPRGRDLPLIAVAVLMCATPFIAARNIALATIAMVEPLVRHAGLAWGMRDAEARSGSLPGRTNRDGLSQAVIAILAIGLAAFTGLFSPRMGGMDLPLGAVNFMRQHSLAGNILNRFEWGGYLEWHLGGSSRVFIDTRYDLSYPQEVVDDYVSFTFASQRGDAVLDSYDHNFVLIARGVPAEALMARRRDWVMLYRDSTCSLYARASSNAAKIPGIPVEGAAPPAWFP